MSEGLKALENIKREAGIPYFSTLYDIDMWREDFATVENELKALEILKRIDVNIQELQGWLSDNDYDEYFDNAIDKVEDMKYILTKQEFDFLREVLC